MPGRRNDINNQTKAKNEQQQQVAEHLYSRHVISRAMRHCIAVNGDKFTTLHRQKGVITILPDSQISIVNSRHAELVIGMLSIIKRGTASQLIEVIAATYFAFKVDMKNDENTHTFYQQIHAVSPEYNMR